MALFGSSASTICFRSMGTPTFATLAATNADIANTTRPLYAHRYGSSLRTTRQSLLSVGPGRGSVDRERPRMGKVAASGRSSDSNNPTGWRVARGGAGRLKQAPAPPLLAFAPAQSPLRAFAPAAAAARAAHSRPPHAW